MVLFFLIFLLSSTFINTAISPSNRRPSSDSEHEGSSGSSSTAVSYHLHPTTQAVVVEQPDSEDGRPGVPALGFVTIPEITLEQRIVGSDLYSTKEYGRLYGIVQTAMTKNWKYKSRLGKDQVEANEMVPWLADAGILIGEKTFIRYCAASLVHEWDFYAESNVLVTSVPCGLMLELAKDRARLRFYRSDVPEYREVVAIHYYQAYAPVTHPNLVVLKIQPIEIPHESNRLTMPYFPGEINEPGQIVWRSDNYEKRSKLSRTIPVSVHDVMARKVECSHCESQRLMVIRPDGNDTSETDLGGSPFYEIVHSWGFFGRRGRTTRMHILRGIRTGLEGDHFTRIDEFGRWIRHMLHSTNEGQ